MFDMTTDLQMESQFSRILRCFDEKEKLKIVLGAISISEKCRSAAALTEEFRESVDNLKLIDDFKNESFVNCCIAELVNSNTCQTKLIAFNRIRKPFFPDANFQERYAFRIIGLRLSADIKWKVDIESIRRSAPREDISMCHARRCSR